jgi:hypothetical protein
MALPDPIEVGDIVGFRFPTCASPYAHPGIVLKLYAGAERVDAIARRGLKDEPGAHLCLMLMVSHSPPPPEECGDLISLEHRRGTGLDTGADLYTCYNHFDLAFIPGDDRHIVSVKGPYLGRLSAETSEHYIRRFAEVQRYLKRRSFERPAGLYRA